MSILKDYSQNNSPFPEDDMRTLAADILQNALAQGATHAESRINIARGFDLSVRKGKLENLSDQLSREIGVSVYFGKRHGTSTLTSLSSKSIQDAVKRACAIAQHSSHDRCAGLADQDLLAFDYPDLKLYYPWDLSIADAKKIAKQCEQAGFEYGKKHGDKIKNSEGATFGYWQACFVYMNSLGFVGGYPSSIYSCNCALLAKQGDDMQRDYGYTVARDPNKLFSVDRVGKEAAQRAMRRLGARMIPTTKCPVIFDAKVSKGIIGSFVGSISGGNLYRQSSFLVDSIGKKVFPEWLSMDERPHLLGGLNSAPFDVEGVRTVPRFLVQDGVVKDYLLSSYSARKLKMRSTGNAGGVRNLFVNHSGQTQAELIKSLSRGLLVTEVMGQGVNIVTGDYSRGVFGYWIENGKIKYPVQGITVAGNLQKMFSGLIAIAKDVEQCGNIHVGSMLVDDMVIGGEG